MDSKLNHQLGDAHLNWEELAVREREGLLKDVSGRKAYGQDDIDKSDRSAGPRMYYSVLLKKLRNIYPAMLVKDGIFGHVACYRPKTDAEIVNDGYDLAVPKWYNDHKYFTGFPKEPIPEWGHYVNDTDGIALKEVRGWRSVLIAMIKQGLVTYDSAVEEFGDPIHDQRSKYWFDQLKQYIKENNSGGRKDNIH